MGVVWPRKGNHFAMFRLLVTGLKQIVQVTDDSDVSFLKGRQMNDIKILNDDSANLCVLVDNEGKVAFVGRKEDVERLFDLSSVTRTIETRGGVLLPGFVDAHSHPVFAGDRVHEFAMKLAGATYMEVQQAGGGIFFTTSKTREATEEDLLKDFVEIAGKMTKCGTTTLEAKSGYGLDLETEMKMLRVLSSADDECALEVSATFCGAHAVPKDCDEAGQTRRICEEMIPLIHKEKVAGNLQKVENIDVFCEKGVFGVESTEKILKAGQKAGLVANFHAEELNYIGGVEMGARIKAKAMSHLEEISDDGISAMSSSGSVAVLLPSTAFILRLTPPPARKMIEKDVIVALGSDFNPNAYCYSMPMIMHLACITMKLSMTEALVAATLNSAHSLGRGSTHGAVAPGRVGDFVILDAPCWEHIIYRMAAHDEIISYVVKRGTLVYRRNDPYV